MCFSDDGRKVESCSTPLESEVPKNWRAWNNTYHPWLGGVGNELHDPTELGM